MGIVAIFQDPRIWYCFGKQVERPKDGSRIGSFVEGEVKSSNLGRRFAAFGITESASRFASFVGLCLVGAASEAVHEQDATLLSARPDWSITEARGTYSRTGSLGSKRDVRPTSGIGPRLRVPAGRAMIVRRRRTAVRDPDLVEAQLWAGVVNTV